jgi:hypothetical protein
VPPCVIAMDELGYVTARRHMDHPGPGTWVYRIALAASYTDVPNTGDPMLYSAPATVRVTG